MSSELCPIWNESLKGESVRLLGTHSVQSLHDFRYNGLALPSEVFWFGAYYLVIVRARLYKLFLRSLGVTTSARFPSFQSAHSACE